MNETILAVEGMTCSSCVRHVEGALRKLQGIGAVAVELKDGVVRVEHDLAKAPLGSLIQVLDEAGYPARAR